MLADFAKPRNIQISCEFGTFRLPFSQYDPVQAAIRELKPVFDAGGKVAYLSLDGPDCRLLKGCINHPNALSLDELAQELAKFWKGVHEVYPEIRIGLISNYPNWDFSRELAGYNGHNTDRSGVTCEEILNKVQGVLQAAGEKLDFVEIDNPCNYYLEKKTRSGDAVHDGRKNLLAIQEWCQTNKVDFHLIVNAEPRGQGAKGFHDLTLEFIRRLRQDGVFPDLFLIQSWYKQPVKNLPESEADTFMNTARDTIRLIHGLYPRP